MPDLVCHLLPGLAAADFSSSTGPEAELARETAYIFRPVALKKVAHHPDGVLWPRQHPGGSARRPVVLLEVQMHADRSFHRRLGAETFRLLQQHEEVAHLQVLVLLAHQRLALGSSQPRLLRRFLQEDVTWVDLAALARQPDLDPLLALLTLPVQKEPDLGPCAQRIVALRPDLIELIVPILSERFQGLSPYQLMATLGISKDFWRHTRAFQDILQEGRQEGREEGRELGLEEGLEEGRRREASALALRQLERRCGSLEVPTSSRIEALSLPQLEELALALLDFRGVGDLQTWLEQLEP
jgi:predicted transposase YdaD